MPGVFVRLFFALGHHRHGSDLQRLACVHVAGFAAVHDIGFRDIDLDNCRVPLCSSLLQPLNLLRSQVDQVVRNVVVHLGFGCGPGLQDVSEFEAEFGAFVANFVVRFFQLREGKLFLAAVRKFDCGLLGFVFVDFFLLAGFG